MWPLQALVPPGAKSWGAQLDCQKHPCTSLHHAFHPMIGFSPHIFEMIHIVLFKHQLLAQPTKELFVGTDKGMMQIALGRRPGSVVLKEEVL